MEDARYLAAKFGTPYGDAVLCQTLLAAFLERVRAPRSEPHGWAVQCWTEGFSGSPTIALEVQTAEASRTLFIKVKLEKGLLQQQQLV